MATTLESLSADEGITGSFGSVPHNVAAEFTDKNQRALISGLNLPMPISMMNYRTLPLDALTEFAFDGSRRDITGHFE